MQAESVRPSQTLQFEGSIPSLSDNELIPLTSNNFHLTVSIPEGIVHGVQISLSITTEISNLTATISDISLGGNLSSTEYITDK